MPSISHIWSHIKGKADARYVKKSQVKTLRGTYSVRDVAAAGSEVITEGLAFGFTLPSAPTPHVIRQNATPPAQCPGTPALPKARPGHFCLYESAGINAGTLGVQNPNGSPGSTARYGTTVFLFSSGAGGYESRGTWAVTMP